MEEIRSSKNYLLNIATTVSVIIAIVTFVLCIVCVTGSAKARGIRYGFDNNKYQLIKTLTTTSVLLAETDGDKLKSTSKMFIYSGKQYVSLVDMENCPITYQAYLKNVQKLKDIANEKKDRDSFLDN